MPFCSNCGKNIDEGQAFCSSCGHSVSSAPATTISNIQTTTIIQPPKSREAAGLLALFLGCIGVHDFYVGKVSQGAIKVILTLTGLGYIISAIWGFVDTICIITGSYHDYWGRPLTGGAPITKILLIVPILFFILTIFISIAFLLPLFL